jgi:hypothetical protein
MVLSANYINHLIDTAVVEDVKLPLKHRHGFALRGQRRRCISIK